MTLYKPSYRKSAKAETLEHNLPETRTTLDKLVDHRADDKKGKKEFAKALANTGFQEKRVDVRRLDGKRLRSIGKFTLYERIHDDVAEIVSPTDLETGRQVITLYQVPTSDLDAWHERLATPSGSYISDPLFGQLATGTGYGTLGALIGVYAEPYIDFVSNLADLPPMGIALTCLTAVGMALVGYFKVGKETQYLCNSLVSQGHGAITYITTRREKTYETPNRREPIHRIRIGPTSWNEQDDLVGTVSTKCTNRPKRKANQA